MSKPSSSYPSSAPTPAPSSPPPPSESFLSDFDGTAPSLIDGSSTEYGFDSGKLGEGSGLNLVSWKLDVNARNDDEIDKRGFNAISTVLNHPTRKANPLRGTRKPLQPIANPPPLPKPPPPTHYDAYLKSVTPLYETFTNAQASSSSDPDGGVSALQAAQKKRLPSLDAIPEVFYDPLFDISSPAVWSSILDSQEEMSTHLDTLESHLIHEITLRSTSFFSALSNLQDLHSESASCLGSITDLQKSLKDVGENQAKKGLSIIDKQGELSLLRSVEVGVKDIGDVQEGFRVAKGLIDGGDWAGGLGCLEDVVNWWNSHSVSTDSTTASQPLPLTGLPALSAIPSQFAELTASVAGQLESSLSTLLSSILTRVGDSDSFDEELFRSSVQPMLVGLVRCGRSDGLEAIWREAVTTSIREGSRKHLPVAPTELDEDDVGKTQDPRGLNLAQALKAMDHSRYLLLSTEMYATLLSRLHLVDRIGKTLASVVSDTSASTLLVIVGPGTEVKSKASAPALDLSDVLSSACELANARSAKILGVRADQHAALSITEFVEIFKENWEFVVATETLAKRMIVSLRGVTASQARTFLISYHGARLTKSAKAVEEEQWSQIDVDSTLQHTVNLLVSSATDDPPECFIPPRPAPTNGDTASVSTKQLNIEDRSYFIVKATSESLGLLADYLTIVINLELVVMDVMSRIIEYLKSFNSRTCQVVLGAGAMRSAGLKNITAKHLALASQSLSIVVALIPYIREFIRRHLNPKQAVMLTEFDKLKRDYQEHQNEIHAKLVAIMSDRLSVHVGSLREINWETVSESNSAHSYAEMLVKETATLHKVLSKYLAPSTVETVLAEVLGAIVTRLSEEYGKVELKSDEARKKMMTDATVIAQRLGPLAEAGKAVASLQTLVRDKPVPRKNVGQAMAGLLKRSSSKKADGDGSEQAETTEPANGQDDADDEGEGLGIIPAEANVTVGESTEEVASREQATETGALPPAEIEVEEPAPTAPPKDAETSDALSPAKEDEPTATETLVADPTEVNSLPVQPVEPIDEANMTSPIEPIVDVAPPPPEKDSSQRPPSTTEDQQPETNGANPDKSPDIPPKDLS